MDFGKLFKGTPRRVYLDYAAATPLHPTVKRAMEPYLGMTFGNPSAIHTEGQHARAAVEEARTLVAKTLGVRAESVLFTGSGTESNNLGILGTLRALHAAGEKYEDMEVISTMIEHPSMRETVDDLVARGVKVEYAVLQKDGVIDLAMFRELLTPQTRMVAIGYANSEIGVVQPLHKMARMIREAEKRFGTRIVFLADGAQAPLWLSCQLERLGVDILTLDAGKCFGPKGVGVLVRKRVNMLPIQYGGGQEAGLRPGTENVAGIVGVATALALAQKDFEARAENVAKVRDMFLEMLKKDIPEAIVNGAMGEERIANNINISLPGIDTEYAVVVLDKHGFAASTKSACSGAGGGVSVVVMATTEDAARAASTIRFSLGPDTSIKDLKRLISVLNAHVVKMQKYQYQ